jgi:hypothetical protein
MFNMCATDSLVAMESQRHSLTLSEPTKTSKTITKTMPQSKYIDEKHTDTASVRSTSTVSSLKSLLHKKQHKAEPTKPTKAQKSSDRVIAHEARATYFALK